MIKTFFCSAFLILWAWPTHGETSSLDLGFDAIVTQFSNSQILSLDGDVSLERKKSKNENEAMFIYSLGATHSKSASPDGNGGFVYEDTNQQTATMGYSRRNFYEVDLGINASQTPAENLKTLGPELALNLTFDLKPKAVPEPEDGDGKEDAETTRPTRFKLAAIIDVIDYTETYDATVQNKKRLPTQVSGVESIIQSSYKLQTKLNTGHFRFKIFYVFYRYNRDLPAFLNLLNTAQSVAINASLFSSTLQGLNVDGEGGSVSYLIGDDWDVTGQSTRYVSAVDGSLSCNYQLTLGFTASPVWRVELAAIHSENEILVDNGGGLNVVYSF